MKVKKIISLFLVAALMVFGVPQYASESQAANTNYQRAIAKYQTVYNVTEYGIDNTGKKDVGSKITSLVKKLAKEPRQEETPIVIYMPSGKYKLTSSIKIYAPNIHIVAEKDSLVSASKSIKGIVEIRDNANTTILGGKWDGNNKAKYGLMFTNAKNASASQCQVTRIAERGIHAINSSVTLTGISSYKNKKYGISTAKGSDITIKNSKIYNNKQHGIVIADSILHMENGNNKVYKNGYSGVSANGKKTKMYISDSQFTQNGTAKNEKGHGIGVAQGAYAEISNNTISKNKQCGISLISSAKAVISSNSIKDNSRHGIGSAVKCNFTADSNTITGNKWHGIMIRDKGSATITNNTLSKNKVAGLSIVGGKATVKGNRIQTNKSNGIFVESATLTLEDNTITKNKAFGIYTDNAKVTLVKGNVIKLNRKGDIDASGSKVTIKKGNTVKKIKR